jgi:glutathione S-transferase
VRFPAALSARNPAVLAICSRQKGVDYADIVFFAGHLFAGKPHRARGIGLAFEARRINFADGEQRSEDFLKINPKGRVPALVTEQGVITETPAILAYIAAIAPAAKLAPLDDPFEFARLQSFNNYICSTVHVNHAHRPRGSRWADDPAAHEAMKAKVPQTMTDSFTLIEEKMFAGPWVMGERYSVADPYLFVMTGWLPSDGVDPASFPRRRRTTPACWSVRPCSALWPARRHRYASG